MHHSGRCGSFELRANGSRFKRTACLWVAKAGGRVHNKSGVCPPVHHPGRCASCLPCIIVPWWASSQQARVCPPVHHAGRCGFFVPWLFVCGLMWLRGCTACETKQSRSVHPARGCDSEAWLVFSGSWAARQYWRAILAGNIGGQYWRAILEGNIGGQYWRAILAGNIALQYWSGATARGFLSASELPGPPPRPSRRQHGHDAVPGLPVWSLPLCPCQPAHALIPVLSVSQMTALCCTWPPCDVPCPLAPPRMHHLPHPFLSAPQATAPCCTWPPCLAQMTRRCRLSFPLPWARWASSHPSTPAW